VLEEWDDHALLLARRLVEADLWTAGEDNGEAGYWFHDWADYVPRPGGVDNPSTSGIHGNHIRWHEGRGVTSDDCEFCHPIPADDRPDDRPDIAPIVGGESRSRPVPTRPDPKEEPSSAIADATRDDVERLCELLSDKIESNGSRRPTVTKAWRNSARLMLDRDNLTEEQITKAINWCQSSEFWRGNVMSMPKLRQKYDALRLAAQRATGNSNGTSFDPAPASRGPWSLPTPPADVADDPELFTAWRTEQYAEHRRQEAAS